MKQTECNGEQLNFQAEPALWGRVFFWLSDLVAGLPGKMRRISEFASIRVLRRTARRRPSLLKVWQPREDPTPFPTLRFEIPGGYWHTWNRGVNFGDIVVDDIRSTSGAAIAGWLDSRRLPSGSGVLPKNCAI